MEAATATEPEPLATRDTAASCLTWLKAPDGRADADARHQPDGTHEDFVSITRLVALVREYGFDGEIARFDWSALHRRGFATPILVVLKNRNVAVLTGGGRGQVEEVAVWDPLDRGGETLYVPREIFERAWSGHAVVIAPRASRKAPAPAAPKTQPPASWSYAGPRRSLTALAMAAAVIAVLVMPVSLADRAGEAGETIRVAFVSPQPMPADRPALPTTAAWTEPARAAVPAGSGGSAAASVAPAPRAAASPPRSAAAPPTVAPPKPLPLSAVSPRATPAKTVVANAAPTPPQPLPMQSAAAPPAKTVAAPTPPPQLLPTPSAAAPSGKTVVASAAPTPSPPKPAPAVAVASLAPSAAARATVAADARGARPRAAPVAADTSALLARGDGFLRLGDVASARPFYERAASAGEWRGAVRLGETFDPAFLARARLSGVQGDLPTALAWYRRARALGASEKGILQKILETP